MAEGVTSPHARRFALAYLALAALLGAGVGAFVLLFRQEPPPPPPPWSSWRPTAPTALARTNEIARHIASRYQLANGKQLVRAYVGTPGAAGERIRAVAVASNPNPAKPEDFELFDASKAVMYILCGSGAKCAIGDGRPSVARAAVLRREALELALYTFVYVKDVESVVTFFPPRSGQNPTYALFFRKADFDRQLGRPIHQTLPQPRPPLPGKLSGVERKTVDELTTSRVFRYAVQNAQDGQRVLVLAPIA